MLLEDNQEEKVIINKVSEWGQARELVVDILGEVGHESRASHS